jgi:hypothetical protein
MTQHDPLSIEIIRSIIDRTGGEKRGNPEIVLVSALAQVLAYSQKNATAASGGDDGRVLMVAGAPSLSFRTPVSAFVPIPE